MKSIMNLQITPSNQEEVKRSFALLAIIALNAGAISRGKFAEFMRIEDRSDIDEFKDIFYKVYPPNKGV